MTFALLLPLLALAADPLPPGMPERQPKYVPGAPAGPAPMTVAQCTALTKTDPAAAEKTAREWGIAGGGLSARQCLGMAQAGLGRWTDAATTFEAVARDAQIAGDRDAALLWMQAGNAALAADEPVRARFSLDRVLDMPGLSNEMKGEVYLDHARANVEAKDLAAAKVDLDQAVKLVPRDPLAWLLLANLSRKRADMPGAFAAIRQAATLAPGDAAVAYEAGNIAAAAGQMEDAKSAWTRAAQTDPQSDAGRAASLALQGGDAAPKP